MHLCFMEQDLLTWKEKLLTLNKKGTKIKLDDNEQGVYSAIRNNPEEFKDMKFSIRTHPVTLIKYVIRTQ